MTTEKLILRNQQTILAALCVLLNKLTHKDELTQKTMNLLDKSIKETAYTLEENDG